MPDDATPPSEPPTPEPQDPAEDPTADSTPAEAQAVEQSAAADTEPTPTTPPPAPVVAPVSAAVPSGDAPTNGGGSGRKGVFVPRWLAVLLGLVLAVALVGGGGFALGRATADDDHDGGHHARVEDRQGGRPEQGDRDGDREDRRTVPNDGPTDRPNGGQGGGQDGTDDVPSTSRVFLGVVVEPAGDGGTGARVVEVSPGSPADEAGLEAGDVITKVDDTDVEDSAALAAEIQQHGDGDEVTITYQREGTTKTATVELTTRTAPVFPSTGPPA